jgi:hypothetical protein
MIILVKNRVSDTHGLLAFSSNSPVVGIIKPDGIPPPGLQIKVEPLVIFYSLKPVNSLTRI